MSSALGATGRGSRRRPRTSSSALSSAGGTRRRASSPAGADARESRRRRRRAWRSLTGFSSRANGSARQLWRGLDFPYEAALARADPDEEAPLRHALEELQELGARP